METPPSPTSADGEYVTVSVRLFARARDLAGVETVALSLPPPATVDDVKEQLRERFPALASILPHLLFAVNNEYVGHGEAIPAGPEVACFPPVSGG